MSGLKIHITGTTPYAIFIVLLCITIYGQTLQFDFINLDDDAYITLNPTVHEGLNWKTTKWAFTVFDEPYYMPLTRISYLVDVSVYGIQAGGFHLTNLALHIINSIILLLLINRLTRSRPASVIFTALFAVHPQHIEAFVWIAERKEVLSALFGLSSLALYIKHVTGKRFDQISDHRYYLLASIFLIFSLLAKPVWVTFPFILLLIDWWPLKRINRESIIGILAEKIPFLLICLLFSFITVYSAAATVDQITNDAGTLPIYQRLSNVPVIYTEYLIRTFLPFDLPNYYPYPRDYLPAWKILGSALLVIGVSLLFFTTRKQNPHLLAGWLWFLGTLFPMTGLMSAGESVFIANRWTYLPHIGLFVSIIWHSLIIYEKYARYRLVLASTGIIVIMIFSISSFNQSKYWQNSVTYWQQALNTIPGNHTAYYMLGTYYLNARDTDKAIRYLRSAYKLNPSEPFYALMLGNAYARRGEIEMAWHYFDSMVTKSSPNIKLLTQMGLIALYNLRFDPAVNYFQAAMASPLESRHHHYKYKKMAYLYAGLALINLDSATAAREMFKHFIGNTREDKNITCEFAEKEIERINLKANRRINISDSLDMIGELCTE
jgi:pentatricopeptide repeat protein